MMKRTKKGRPREAQCCFFFFKLIAINFREKKDEKWELMWCLIIDGWVSSGSFDCRMKPALVMVTVCAHMLDHDRWFELWLSLAATSRLSRYSHSVSCLQKRTSHSNSPICDNVHETIAFSKAKEKQNENEDTIRSVCRHWQPGLCSWWRWSWRWCVVVAAHR